MKRRACWQVAAFACKQLLSELQPPPVMVSAQTVRLLSSAPRVSGLCRPYSSFIRQSWPIGRLTPLEPSRPRSVITAATRVATPAGKKRAQSKPSSGTQHSEFSSSVQPETAEPEPRQSVPEATTSAKPVKADRRSGRKAREVQPKDEGSSTDLRCVHGVGPKNEQLLLKIGLSSVASLKEVFRVEHKESTLALKRYLQVLSLGPIPLAFVYSSGRVLSFL